MKRLLTTVVVLTGLFGGTGAVWADAQSDFDKGYQADAVGDHAEAVKWYRKAAEQGYAPAQFRLGNRYHYGDGVTQDYAEALKWYRKADEQGNAKAQYILGDMYYKGDGVTQDYAEAVKWFRKADEQGHVVARPRLEYIKAKLEKNCALSDGHPLVGLCWRSSDNRKQFSPRADFLQCNEIDFETYIAHGHRYWRKNINLSYFEDIIANPTIRTVSLQYGLAEWEVGQMAAHPIYSNMLISPIDHFSDLDIVASEVAALDAFVTIPCGYAHLAAALGVPTFVLLNDQPPAYWVWNERFPIYPNVRTYRKRPEWIDGDIVSRKYDGDWSETIAALSQDLFQFLVP